MVLLSVLLAPNAVARLISFGLPTADSQAYETALQALGYIPPEMDSRLSKILNSTRPNASYYYTGVIFENVKNNSHWTPTVELATIKYNNRLRALKNQSELVSFDAKLDFNECDLSKSASILRSINQYHAHINPSHVLSTAIDLSKTKAKGNIHEFSPDTIYAMKVNRIDVTGTEIKGDFNAFVKSIKPDCTFSEALSRSQSQLCGQGIDFTMITDKGIFRNFDLSFGGCSWFLICFLSCWLLYSRCYAVVAILQKPDQEI